MPIDNWLMLYIHIETWSIILFMLYGIMSSYKNDTGKPQNPA